MTSVDLGFNPHGVKLRLTDVEDRYEVVWCGYSLGFIFDIGSDVGEDWVTMDAISNPGMRKHDAFELMIGRWERARTSTWNEPRLGEGLSSVLQILKHRRGDRCEEQRFTKTERAYR